MDDLYTQFVDNSKFFFTSVSQLKFFIKIFIIFIVYLIANYIFDRIDHEDLMTTFHSNPYLTIKIPNNITFKILITIVMIIISHFVYIYLLKPIVYPKD